MLKLMAHPTIIQGIMTQWCSTVNCEWYGKPEYFKWEHDNRLSVNKQPKIEVHFFNIPYIHNCPRGWTSPHIRHGLSIRFKLRGALNGHPPSTKCLAIIHSERRCCTAVYMHLWIVDNRAIKTVAILETIHLTDLLFIGKQPNPTDLQFTGEHPKIN